MAPEGSWLRRGRAWARQAPKQPADDWPAVVHIACGVAGLSVGSDLTPAQCHRSNKRRAMPTECDISSPGIAAEAATWQTDRESLWGECRSPSIDTIPCRNSQKQPCGKHSQEHMTSVDAPALAVHTVSARGPGELCARHDWLAEGLLEGSGPRGENPSHCVRWPKRGEMRASGRHGQGIVPELKKSKFTVVCAVVLGVYCVEAGTVTPGLD